MPAKKTKDPDLKDLKSQLKSLQTKIEDMEGQDTGKEYFSWRAPERVFVPRNKKWFGNVGLIVLVLLLITLFLQEFLLMGVILALVFVVYILATVPPEEIQHRITDQGIISHGRSFLWEELADFWFDDKYDYRLMTINTYLRFPAQITFIINKKDESHIKQILTDFLPYREVPPRSFVDRAGQWVTKKLSSV
jgi:hypothetical protein